MKKVVLTLRSTALSRRPLYPALPSRWKPQANRVRRPVSLFFWSRVSRLWCWICLRGSDPSAINWQWYVTRIPSHESLLYHHIPPCKPFDGRVACSVNSDGCIFAFYHSKVSRGGVEIRGNWKSIYVIKTIGCISGYIFAILQQKS